MELFVRIAIEFLNESSGALEWNDDWMFTFNINSSLFTNSYLVLFQLYYFNSSSLKTNKRYWIIVVDILVMPIELFNSIYWWNVQITFYYQLQLAVGLNCIGFAYWIRILKLSWAISQNIRCISCTFTLVRLGSFLTRFHIYQLDSLVCLLHTGNRQQIPLYC